MSTKNMLVKSTISTIFLLLLLTAGLTAPCLTAQGVTGELRTLTNVGVFARQGTQTGFQTIPAGKLLPSGSGASATTHINNGNSHMATLIGFNSGRAGIVTVDLSEQGGVSVGAGQPPATVGTTASLTAAAVRPGPHALILKLTGRPGSIGLIDTWAGGGTNRPTRGVSGTYILDVGNDGSSEFKVAAIGGGNHSFIAKIPASGVLMVKLASEVTAKQSTTGGFLFKSGMSFRWTPAPFCVLRSYGEICGPRLAGKVARNGGNYQFGLSYTKGTPNGASLLIVGTDRTAVRIPGVRCLLLTNPRLVTPFRANRVGGMSWSFRVPVQAIDLRLQAADLGSRTPAASNGLHVACRQ